LFAAGTKDPPHQPVDFMPQQFILPAGRLQLLLALRQLAGKFKFKRRHLLVT
jgi:hypothetical protein